MPATHRPLLRAGKGKVLFNQNSLVHQEKLPPPGLGIEPGFPGYEGYALPLGPHHVFEETRPGCRGGHPWMGREGAIFPEIWLWCVGQCVEGPSGEQSGCKGAHKVQVAHKVQ